MRLLQRPAEARRRRTADEADAGPHLVLLAMSRRGYGNLSQWITVARRRAPKGEYVALMGDVEGKVPDTPTLAGLPDCLALLLCAAGAGGRRTAALRGAVRARASGCAPGSAWFGDRAALALPLLHRAHDALLATSRSAWPRSPGCRSPRWAAC
jgi:error-prone DNA polymerase